MTIHKLSLKEIPQLIFYEKVLFNRNMATVSQMGVWYIYLAQIFGAILLAFNRFSAVAFPISYEQVIWQPIMSTS